MTATTIHRDLAERCLEFIARNGLSYDSMRLASDIRAALSAPAGPLTAEECRAFLKRTETLPPNRSRRPLQIHLQDMLHLLEHAPAWTGSQPVVDGQITEEKDT